jgi:hypothetical protein
MSVALTYIHNDPWQANKATWEVLFSQRGCWAGDFPMGTNGKPLLMGLSSPATIFLHYFCYVTRHVVSFLSELR